MHDLIVVGGSGKGISGTFERLAGTAAVIKLLAKIADQPRGIGADKVSPVQVVEARIERALLQRVAEGALIDRQVGEIVIDTQPEADFIQ